MKMTKPSIQKTTEERIACIKGRIKDMYESIGKAYVEGRDDLIPYFQMHLNAWQDELRKLEEHKVESKPFAVFETKEEYDEHCELIAKGAVDDMLQNVISEVKDDLNRYWAIEKVRRDRGESIDELNGKIHVALGTYTAILRSLDIELIWCIDWKDSESRVYKVYGRRLDNYSVTFCMTNFGKDEWWQ
jgi:hypothetical protein